MLTPLSPLRNGRGNVLLLAAAAHRGDYRVTWHRGKRVRWPVPPGGAVPADTSRRDRRTSQAATT